MSIRKKLLNYFGIDTPEALTAREWDEYYIKVKQEHPVAWFIIDTVPSEISLGWYKFTKPFRYLYRKFQYKFINKYHIIETGLKPGYADLDTRMTNAMFNLVVNFVEIDKAMMQELWNEDVVLPPTIINKITRYFKQRKIYKRNPEAGLKYLQWEMSLGSTSPSQAEAAAEIWQIYHWWKFVRSARPDPMDASGWTAHCARLKARNCNMFDTDDLTKDERLHGRQALDLCRQIEEDYEQEDDQYLIRLIKIRKSLWQ